MESNCPKPSENTPEDNKLIQKEYKLKSSINNSNEYDIKLIAKDTSLSIYLCNINEITPFIYQKVYTLEDLIKISKVFKLCDNITEVISYINENFESNLVTLKEENIDSVNLNFKMTLPNKSEENFKFEISKIHLQQNESFDILFKAVSGIKKENKKKDEEIEILKTEINNLKQQINSMKIEFEKKNKEISEQLFSLLNKQNILNNKIFKNLIENAIIEKREEIKNKNIGWKLIYKASRDGGSVTDCHSKCNNISDTVSIIFSSTGRIFGVYRNIAINGDGPWRIDNNAFIFSVDNNKIYRVKKGNAVIAFDNRCFIQYMNTLVLTGNILTEQYEDKNTNTMNNYFEGFTRNFELNGGNQYYYVEEFLVYSLNFS
jgi:hypothetical protein